MEETTAIHTVGVASPPAASEEEEHDKSWYPTLSNLDLVSWNLILTWMGHICCTSHAEDCHIGPSSQSQPFRWFFFHHFTYLCGNGVVLTGAGFIHRHCWLLVCCCCCVFVGCGKWRALQQAGSRRVRTEFLRWLRFKSIHMGNPSTWLILLRHPTY